MPGAQKTAPNEKNFTKRRSVAEGLELADAAHAATWRLYCDAFALWRTCRSKSAGTTAAA